MGLLLSLRTLSEKLRIAEDEMLLLYAYNRDWLGKWGLRRAYVAISNIVERFGLTDDPDDPTYGEQLRRLGILTGEEANLFSEAIYHGTPEGQQEPQANAGTNR
jgi:uncharacterized protein YutE (UPF0331/DUF86 family)